MIVCGWCGEPTFSERCGNCGHDDPSRPWVQRGREVPQIDTGVGRHSLDEQDIRQRYGSARSAVISAGREPTIEHIAEELDRSPRTVREWRKRYGLH